MKSFSVFHRAMGILLIGAMVLGLFGGLIWATATDLTGMTSFVFNGNSLTVTKGSDTNFEVVVYSADTTETAATATTNANGSITYSVPSGVNGELQVGIKKAGGNYVFSGNGVGNIVVKKAATADADLYFNGLTLTSGFTSVLTVNKDSTANCNLHMVKDTVTTFTDNAGNNDETNASNLAAENAVIKAKASSNLTIGGEGTLKIKANGKNGIKANNLLTITDSVILNIEAVDDGISGENAITINSGTVTIKATGGDGIKCGADDAAVGSVTVNGGKLTIDSYGDGIQATANLTVNGGVLHLTCYGGYTATYNSSSSSYPSAKGLKAAGSYVNASGNEVDATECSLKINGGYITINSADDAIHSDKEITITAGVIDLYTNQSAGDGIHADYTNTLGTKGGKDTDLYISIHKCYEGIEGANIYIHSGIINVIANDDSINAANSDLGSSGPGMNSSYAFSVDVTGGVIYCSSSKGDCLDSNKNFTISGGTLVVLGSITQMDNSAVDVDGSFNIQGGEILTIGNASMLTNPTTTQSYCTWTSAGTVTASASGGSSSGQPGQIGRPGGNRPGQSGSSSGGSVVGNNKQLTVTDASGNTLISVVVKWDSNPTGSAGYVLYSSPNVTSGSSYTVTVGTAQTVTGGSYITSKNIPAQPETPDSDETVPPVTDEPSTPVEPDEPTQPENPDDPSGENPPPEPPSGDGEQPTPPSGENPPPEPPSGDGEQPDLPQGMTKGDVNGDGEINAKDALLVLKFTVNKETPTMEQNMVADVNGDRQLSAVDALWILQYTVGKRPSFA